MKVTESLAQPMPPAKTRWILPVLLLPMNVLVFIPAVVLWLAGHHWEANHSAFLAIGCVLLLCGMSLAAWTVWLFHSIGLGTAAPWAPP
ncbi:MAG: hypothetical protein LBI88_02550, partial [Deltaproteobacteria bacterium]|nr:hypothetical protein [Deltaproteobacteria bacterium]